jgi:hypothetical protein
MKDDLIRTSPDTDGIDRRGFLKCMPGRELGPSWS